MNVKFSLCLLCLLVAPYARTATCLIDPFEKPIVSSPYGAFRQKPNATVHQGFDMVPITWAKESYNLKAAEKGKVVFADFIDGKIKTCTS